MEINTEYEMMVLKEIREIPANVRPQVLNIIRSLRESLLAVDTSKREKLFESGLCGIWDDDQSAEEIIKEIHEHRTGYGGREVEL